MKTIVSKELVRAVHNVVSDQAIKTHKELSAKVILYIVNVSQSKELVTSRIVPGREVIQIETFLNCREDVS